MHKTHPIDRLANVNGFVTGLALWPQVIKAIVSGTTDGLSTVAFGIIFLNSVVWIAYARHRRLNALLVASLLNLAASAVIVVMMLA